MPEPSTKTNPDLSNRSDQQLRAEAEQLGLTLPADISRKELEACVQQRVAFVESLDRGALLDLAVWADVPVDHDPPNHSLVGWIVAAPARRFNGLSERGLRLFAELRNVPVPEAAQREEIERLLRKPQSFWEAVRRRRRRIMGSILGRAFEPSAARGTDKSTSGPRPDRAQSLKRRIESHGVVGGLANTLRGVADDYVARQLDEIERRIDIKLDEIDLRLAEWRDREVSNRLKILKITLIFSILVALISLGYDYLRSKPGAEHRDSGDVQRVIHEYPSEHGVDARPTVPPVTRE